MAGGREERCSGSPRTLQTLPPVLVLLLAACFLGVFSLLWAHAGIVLRTDCEPTPPAKYDGRHGRESSSSRSPPPAAAGTSSWRSYASALTAIRCLVTPGCFRSIRCRAGRPEKVPRGKRWEERAFCVDDLRSSATSDARGGGGGGGGHGGGDGGDRCLVYSVGLFNSWQWEEKVARLFGCEVHAFDPTMDKPTGSELAPGVTFHRLGLQGGGTNMSATHGADYKAIDAGLLMTLGEIVTRLGHENRTIDLLSMDCEGCEWGVIRQMACSSDSRRVSQISVELHFQKALGLRDESDVFVAAEGIQCLEREGWGIVSIEASGAGQDDWHYTRGVSGVIHNPGFLAYVALRQINAGEGERLPADLMDDRIVAGRRWFTAWQPLADKYGRNESKWPEDAISIIRPITSDLRLKNRAYAAVYHERVSFDEHPRMNEVAQ